MKKIVDSIEMRVNKYGLDTANTTSRCDEECERELEMEREVEEEVEVELALMKPMSETPWEDFTTALACQSPLDLPRRVGVKSLGKIIATFLEPAALGKINWSKKVYCTNNFTHTIVCQQDNSHSAVNSFLRVVNFMLSFPDGSFLLLSEYEGNNILKLFWDHPHQEQKRHHLLLHSCLLRHDLDGMSSVIPLQLSLPLDNYKRASEVIGEDSMATVQLFDGETTYKTNERKEALRSLLRVPNANGDVTFCPRAETERLVEMRGLGKKYPYSDLESTCEFLLSES